MANRGFAVLDLETTGLGKADKVVEIGIIFLDENAEFEGSFSSLINPMRDVGATHIHGLRAKDLVNAPTFDQLADYIEATLTGRVLVAHNARFDVPFLEREFAKIGRPFLAAKNPVVCTLELASDLLPGVGRSLAACCESCGINNPAAHSAEADALAAAELLRVFINSGADDVLRTLDYLPDDKLSGELVAPATLQRGSKQEAIDEVTQFIRRIVEVLPDAEVTKMEREFLQMLDDALVDGFVSETESTAISAFAQDSGIARDRVSTLLNKYFHDFVTAAVADGEVTKSELIAIRYVGQVTNQPSSTLDVAIAEALKLRSDPEPHANAEIQLAEGDKVVVTGETSRPRSEMEDLIRALGFVPWGSVTKTVKLVVAADVTTFSGKAKRARLLGVPIIDEITFVQRYSL